MSEKSVRDVQRLLIEANHIVFHYGICDAYGHVSVRDPVHADHFWMARYLAPATVSSAEDLVAYRVDDASPVDPNAPRGYSERFIHSECLKAMPHIQSVVHSHAEEVLPFGVTDVNMQPVYHMAGFLGSETPVFDIAKHYEAGDQHDMLVRQQRFGKALAECFRGGPDNGCHAVVLMRGHGMTTIGESLQEAVMRAIYTRKNAQVQSSALSISNGRGVRYLSAKECEGTLDMAKRTVDRPWRLWQKEVADCSLYRNNLA